MRIVATTICALMLAGCASSLPYSIAIGDPSKGTNRLGQKECVLRLDDIVEKIASAYSPPTSTLRSLQMEFEKELHEGTQALEHCADGNGNPVQPDAYPPIEEISKKWLTTYALDATNPDQSLDRLREYVRSAQLVENLARQPISPDEDKNRTYLLVEEPSQNQSQWCGPDGGLKKESICFKARSLYHVETELKARTSQANTDLYEYLLSDIVQVERKGTQRNQRYLMLGYEIPWDKERTLVRYGVTFYFRQIAPENGEPASESNSVQLIGYDLVYANEATPAPVEPGTDGTPKRSREGPSPWQENPWRITGYPFSLVIGLKNAAFEIVKLPFSTLAGLLFGRDAWNYPAENVITAWNALYVEATTQTHRGAEWGLYRLLT
ncbi:MAG: hypothetical protein HY281_05050, partial [Nitrospirae bacterium]|nr:hypothetical protein [Nitrospirota bacterium]